MNEHCSISVVELVVNVLFVFDFGVFDFGLCRWWHEVIDDARAPELLFCWIPKSIFRKEDYDS